MASSKAKGLLTLLAVAVVVMAPGFVLSLTGHTEYAAVAGFGALSCLLPTLYGGWKVGLGTAVGVAIAGGLALSWSDNAWLAALLMLVVGIAVGLTARPGWNAGMILAPITIALILATPPTGSDHSLAVSIRCAIILLASGVFAAIVGALVTMKGPVQEPKPNSPGRSLNYGLTLGILLMIAAWFTVTLESGKPGMWAMMTIILVIQPVVKDSFSNALQRAGGTVIGVVIAILLALIPMPDAVFYIVAVIALALAFLVKSKDKADWQFIAMLTITMVILQGIATSIEQTAIARLWATLLGAAAAIIVMFIEWRILKDRVGDRASARGAST